METKSSFVFSFLLGYLLGSNVAATCYDADLSAICGVNVTYIPYLSTRGNGTVVTEELLQGKYCDVFALDRDQWYHSNTPMTTTCPDMYMCGTKFPIWLNGRIPVPNGSIVNMTACLRDSYTCCRKTYSIAVVNCGETHAYCFNELTSECNQRYCFDEQYENTLHTTPGTTLQTTPGTTLQTTHGTTLQTTPGTTIQTTPETTLQTTPKTTLQTTPETTLQTSPDTTPQTSPERTLQTSPETTLQTTLETTLHTTPETILQTSLETTQKTTSDTILLPSELTSTVRSSSTKQAQHMERKDSDAIIILVSCLCVLLSVVIALLVLIIRRRRTKQSKNSITTLDKPGVDEWIPKTADIGRQEHVRYESLKNLERHDFLGVGYASLKQLDGRESDGDMKCLSQREVIFDAMLLAMNKLYERPAIVSGDYEVPNSIKEEDHYETLP